MNEGGGVATYSKRSLRITCAGCSRTWTKTLRSDETGEFTHYCDNRNYPDRNV